MIQLLGEKKKNAILSVVAVMTMAIVGLFCTQDTYAGVVQGCSSYGGECTCDAPSCGAAWMNGNPNVDTNNFVVVDGNQNITTAFIHGAVYTLSSNPQGAGGKSTAYHTRLIRDDWTGSSHWDNGAHEGEVSSLRVDFMWVSGNDDFGRGKVSGNPGDWSDIWYDDWGSPAAQVTIDVNRFIGGAWVDNVEEWEDWNETLHVKTTYARNVFVYRCYYFDDSESGSAGCGTGGLPVTIFLVQEKTYPPPKSPDQYRVYLDGKVSLNNDGGSPLFRGGAPFTNNSGDCRYGSALCSGWEDYYNAPKIYTDLYTPKDYGQRLSSTFQLKYIGNGWENSDLQWWAELYYPDKHGRFWQTHYNYSSSIGGNRGSGNFRIPYVGWYENEVTPTKSRTLSIPYGTDLTLTEYMRYDHDSNRASCRHVKKPIKGSDPVEYEEYDECNWNSSSRNSRERTVEVNIHNPFNFNTAVHADIGGGNGSTVLGGSVVNLNFVADLTPKINPNINEYPYYTKVPNNTRVTAASFIVKQDVNYEQAAKNFNEAMKEKAEYGGLATGGNLCQYISGYFGNSIVNDGVNNCKTLFTKNSGDINNSLVNVGERITNGRGSSTIPNETNYPVVIPDVDDGYKYCTVIGINHATSGGGYEYNMNNNWHISNIACRTIARVPNFQTWGNIYTTDSIKTVTTKKVGTYPNAANIGTLPNEPSYLFGSWAETFALANKDITGFGTGASTGYNGDKKGGLPALEKTNYCDIVNMSIANKQCKDDKPKAGNEGNVVVANEDFLSRFVSHFSTTNTGTLDQVTSDVKYYRAANSATINDTNVLRDNGYILGNGVVSLNEGTLVYQVDGDLTISHNICTGYPNSNAQCNNGLTTKKVREQTNLDKSNVRYIAGTSRIPQIILIASGNVYIDPSVTEIDAWIYSGKTIRTCATPAEDKQWYLTCNNPLMVHGPVFAKKVELHRTYGAYGARNWDWGFLTKTSPYLEAGPVTAAEIFDLRADVYQWIYQQINNGDKSANIRYSRELAPRY